jgi:microcystin degradation protein MlrC
VRVGIGGIVHETNQYAPRPTTAADFRVRRAESLLVEDSATFLGGMLRAADDHGHEVIGLLYAAALPGGPIVHEDYRRLKMELLDRIRRSLNSLDAVVLELHGAAASDRIDDLDGDLCAGVRDLVGPDLPIVAAHDLHAHISDVTAAAVSMLVSVQEYPHDDMFDCGYRAVTAVNPLLTGAWKPTMAICRLPLLLPCTTTYTGVGAEVRSLARQVSEQRGVLEAAVLHGFPQSDHPGVGARTVVTTNNNPDLAARLATGLAEQIWVRRHRFLMIDRTPEEAVAAALSAVGRPVIVNETSDNPGGGAPGDGTHLLRALLDAAPGNSVFCGLCDPSAVQVAHASGVGSTVEMTLGGRAHRLQGEPIICRAYVRTLTDGAGVIEAAMMRGWAYNLGPTVGLVVNGVDVLVFSAAMQTIDRTPLLLHGIDPTRRNIIAIKSAQHFRTGFTGVAGTILTADGPGLTTQRLDALPRPRTPRPVFPLDPATAFRPGQAG